MNLARTVSCQVSGRYRVPVTTTEDQWSPQFIYDTAKAIAASNDDALNFLEAHVLCRLVLQFGGRPVNLRNRTTPSFDKKAIRRLENAGWIERGGYQGNRKATVTSALNLLGTSEAWTATAQVDEGRLNANLISAADEAVLLIARFTVGEPVEEDEAANGDPEALLLRPQNEDWYRTGELPLTEPMEAFDESGRPQFELRHALDALVRDVCSFSDEHELLMERPSPGTIAITSEIHECGMSMCQCAARFDMQVETKDGRPFWANLCAYHARKSGLTTLGMGHAQYLLHPDELDEPAARSIAKTFNLPLSERIDRPEPAWSKAYRLFGFVRADDGRLVRRGPTTTVWAALAMPGVIGIKIRRVRSFTFDDRGWDVVHPIDWSEDLVREVLFDALNEDRDLPRCRPLTMGVDEAETIVKTGLDTSDSRIRIHDHLTPSDRARFGELAFAFRPSPYGRASEVVSASSLDYKLLRRIFAEHPDPRHRHTIVGRTDCPVDILVAATGDAACRASLLHRKAGLPTEVIDPLFIKVALSSTSQESRGTMLEATLHPAVPLAYLGGIIEKALAESDARTVLIRRSAGLDDERRTIIRAAVLRKTHRGRVQDAVMTELLGHEGHENQKVLDWLYTLADRPARERAFRWIEEHRGQELATQPTSNSIEW